MCIDMGSVVNFSIGIMKLGMIMELDWRATQPMSLCCVREVWKDGERNKPAKLHEKKI